MYAFFQTGGKQFRAEPGVRLRIPTLQNEPGDSVTFEHVLLTGDGEESVRVGTPTVDGASVTAEVLRHGRGDKIIVFKRKRRKGYRKKQGHRQNFTEIRIDAVALG
ncbi:MAG: 50S ribosomal protein L21 [Gemmatimonadetes bacterium]|nr:50S ribosomal protein L21 [Gemmatimonadota bacterium]